MPEPVPEPDPQAEPEPEPEPEDDDAERDAEAAAALAAALQEQGEESPLSQDELDAMFAEPDSLQSYADGDDDDSVDYDEIDDIPDPEPIPDVFTSPENLDRSERRFGLGLILSMIAAVVVVGIVASMLLARDAIVSMAPGLASVYDVIGMGEPPVGQGLEIRAILTDRKLEADVDVAVVSGTIVNNSDHAIAVPHIQVILADSNGVPLKNVVVAPQQPEIAAGGNFRFSARVENPPPLARRVDITFIRPPAMSNGDMAEPEPAH